MEPTTRALNSEEMRLVNGGILPVIAAAGSFVGHAAVRSVGRYLFTRAMTTYSVYSAAEYLNDFSED